MSTHVTNSESGTNVAEIAPNIYRISTPVPPSAIPGGFTFNQFLVVDDQPLLFHTGYRKMFPLVSQAVAHILGDVAKLRYVAFSHVEGDESGALNDFLAAAPQSVAVCSNIGVMVQVNDLADRAPRGMADGEELVLGKRRMKWLDAPHLPHNWECGYMFEATTRTLLCGDIFSQGGNDPAPLTESDVLAPAEAFRKAMPGVMCAVEKNTRAILEKLARTEPATLAIMHGSSYRGNGAALLRAFGDALGV